MTPEEHYKEVVKLDMDKFDKKMPKFDYYDLLDFADSYYKKQLTLTDVSQQRELLLAYEDYLNEYHTKEDRIKQVDKYLKANNCG
jgi:hypothetical protein